MEASDLVQGKADACEAFPHAATAAKIRVTTLDGKATLFEVEGSETLGGVKSLIQEQLGKDPKCQLLVFGKMRLEDDNATLGSIGIADGATLTLLESEKRMKIGVKIPAHRNSFGRVYVDNECVIDSGFTILNIKEKILNDGLSQATIDRQRLVDSGEKPLEDSDLATDCGIQEGSTIKLLVKGLKFEGGW
jgi:hypothetical protein